MKMEPMVSSETSAIRTQTPGNYPKRNRLHLEHGESLKTKKYLRIIFVFVSQGRAQYLILGNIEKKVLSNLSTNFHLQ